MSFSINNAFKQWATSHSGYEGGNITGPIWFCGIEYGGGIEFNKLDFSIIENTPSLEDRTAREGFIKHRYNQGLLPSRK